MQGNVEVLVAALFLLLARYLRFESSVTLCVEPSRSRESSGGRWAGYTCRTPEAGGVSWAVPDDLTIHTELASWTRMFRLIKSELSATRQFDAGEYAPGCLLHIRAFDALRIESCDRLF